MPTKAEASFLSSPSGWGLGRCTRHRSRSWPFARAELNLPSPAAGGGQASRFGAALQRRSRQAALERPGPNSSSPVEARQGSRALAGGPQGLWPEWVGVAVRGAWPAPQPAPLSCLSAPGYLWLGETQGGLRGACSSCRLAAFCSFSSGGEVLPETQCPVFQGVLQSKVGWVWVGGKWQEWSAGCSGTC